MTLRHYLYSCALLLLLSCSKKDTPIPVEPIKPPTGSFTFTALKVNELFSGFSYFGLNTSPVFKVSFSGPVDKTSVASAILIKDKDGNTVKTEITYENNDQNLIIKPVSPLKPVSKYFLDVQTNLKAGTGANLNSSITVNFITQVDPSDKFPLISDDELLTLVQKQTFKYFWDFAHPNSGLSRERNTSGNLVTSGGSGFGIMALITGVHRNFISRSEGLGRMQKIVAFLKDKAQRFHGAYPHWLDGNTGAVIPFSPKDNGADLVETSFLMQGMLSARQFFNNPDPIETALRKDISTIYNEVEWDWFRKDNSNTLYWHWSPTLGWDMNMPIKGWNEALITYVLAASSTTHGIPKNVYDNGWANNGSMKNGGNFYNVQLPLGPVNGGPLFFSHYSFLGINPIGLKDAYADYEAQTKAHSLIHYNYAKANPKNFYGYGESCWGLTASDDINGYLAHEPNNDNGVISPTAALSSFPYTPVESMQALKYFYYKLGDKIWSGYGFTDAFSLHDAWFASSTLAIDQGPIIIMIENHRSKLLWNLFMSAPEVKAGMQKLGFTSPNL
jgi:hypothetical protein